METTKESQLLTKPALTQKQTHARSTCHPGWAYLDREVIGAEAEVIPSTERRMLGAKMHLNMLEEVMILKGTDSFHEQGGNTFTRCQDGVGLLQSPGCLTKVTIPTLHSHRKPHSTEIVSST